MSCFTPAPVLSPSPFWLCVARRWGPHRWRPLRVPPRPRLLLFFLPFLFFLKDLYIYIYIYINSFLGSHGQLGVCPIQEVLYQIWDFNFAP